jgi:drug/metabolite transporter (DMT)-like permease
MNAPKTGSAAPWLSYFVLLAAIWGSSFLFMRLAVVDFGPLATAAVRVAIASAFLLPLVWLRGLLLELRTHWRKTFFIGILNSGIPFACFAFALQSINTSLSAVLNATVPMFGALIAWVWLKDQLSAARVLGLGVGFLGVTLLAWDTIALKSGPGSVDPAWAVAACLFACLCYGIGASYTRKYLGQVPSLVTAAGSQIGATLGLMLPAAWAWPAKMPGLQAWTAVTVVGVLCTGVAYVLFFKLMQRAGPQKTLSVTFLVPAFAALYGVVFLREAITPWMLMCAAVIVCGTALSTGLIGAKPASPPPT